MTTTSQSRVFAVFMASRFIGFLNASTRRAIRRIVEFFAGVVKTVVVRVVLSVTAKHNLVGERIIRIDLVASSSFVTTAT